MTEDELKQQEENLKKEKQKLEIEVKQHQKNTEDFELKENIYQKRSKVLNAKRKKLNKKSKEFNFREREFELLQSGWKKDEDVNENENKGIIAWKMCRSAIEHENELINHRLTWLFSSQAFLFTGFFLIVSKIVEEKKEINLENFQVLVIGLIAFIGVSICSIIFFRIRAAMKQHDEIKNWFGNFFLMAFYPPICGVERLWEKLLRLPLFPLLFIMSWNIALDFFIGKNDWRNIIFIFIFGIFSGIVLTLLVQQKTFSNKALNFFYSSLVIVVFGITAISILYFDGFWKFLIPLYASCPLGGLLYIVSRDLYKIFTK